MPLDFTKGSITLDFAQEVEAGALAEDVLGSAGFGDVEVDTQATYWSKSIVIANGADLDLGTRTLTYDSASLAVGVAVCAGRATASFRLKLQLIMGGVQVAEGIYLDSSLYNYTLMGTRALSGSQTCISRLHAYDAGASYQFHCQNQNDWASGGIAAGSVKLV